MRLLAPLLEWITFNPQFSLREAQILMSRRRRSATIIALQLSSDRVLPKNLSRREVAAVLCTTPSGRQGRKQKLFTLVRMESGSQVDAIALQFQMSILPADLFMGSSNSLSRVETDLQLIPHRCTIKSIMPSMFFSAVENQM